MKKEEINTEFAQKKITAEISELAMQAGGSAIVRYGDTVVLAAATMSNVPREGANFLPLTVDYEEKFYASGEILGSRFVRRESRPSEGAVLTGRLIDRTIRPLFDQRIRNDVHLMIMVLSLDEENSPDIPAIIASSLALGLSNIPWNGPVGAIRIGYLPEQKKFVLNPSYLERQNSIIDLVVCSKSGKINMLEAKTKEAAEDIISEGIDLAQTELQKIEKFQKEIISRLGKQKTKFQFKEAPQNLKDLFKKSVQEKLEEAVYITGKSDRLDQLTELKKEWLELVKSDSGGEFLNQALDLYEDGVNDIVHKNILNKEKRPDGRRLDELRSLYVKTLVLPRTHGSAVFFRGETHILSVVTLGGVADVLIVEGMEIKAHKRFIHHYNFPPFSTGEAGRAGSPGRREIGHGALAEKALESVIPPKEVFPYTIRIVSEALSSNGSTSMASVCASSLALMDAGVPIKTPVAGIAMGLMMENENKFKVLTDIQGPEDHHGDMDLKIAKTKNGITALQMDVKVEGITLNILKAVFAQAGKAIEEIFKTMKDELSESKKQLSPFAPRIIQHRINPERIKDVIGPGGRIIQNITTETKTEIDINQDGLIYITGPDETAVNKALEIIAGITREFKVGEVFEGRVSRFFDFGAMVEIAPNQEGLVRISEISPFRVEKISDVLSIGELVPVKIISIDDIGRINLSIKDLTTLKPKRKSRRDV